MSFENVNVMIEKFYKLFYETEELILKQGIKCLTTTELHVVEAIGNDSLTMNELSDRLGITMGTATVAINKLNDKGFINRKRSDKDRRKVFVELSRKGLKALKYHETFHQDIISKITKNLSNAELESFTTVFGKILTNLENQIEFVKPDIINNFMKGCKIKITEIKGSTLIKKFFKENGIVENKEVKILDKNKYNITLLVDNNKVEIDTIDSKNIIGLLLKD
ncbi:DNA-binding MarR family transcriptional regulator [Hypnocyclicus thermotrophus]|uniref:DNA-binding MarR family transcriptional regulator n=1 Tax=Hypnocyclicus thermotrophus TaxID=1627895 RepID=A0AA46I563_9FUSO|nr:MarR family winged helix-turn-helix transcriptional regulator [Hypnocyclicus thermotrophus]TDT68529.1 DNA-binding MarR family transcriptional regulator [Hypnocyclicus thermotrophus]